VSFTAGTLAFWNNEKEIQLYQMLRYEVHCPSEHTFDEKTYDCEVHFIHQSYDLLTLAVIAVYFDIEAGGNTQNDFIQSLQPRSSWRKQSLDRGCKSRVDQQFGQEQILLLRRFSDHSSLFRNRLMDHH
jgi:carbonic anhydrase